VTRRVGEGVSGRRGVVVEGDAFRDEDEGSTVAVYFKSIVVLHIEVEGRSEMR